jgi:hypothetical protein
VGWQPSRFLADRAEAERAFQFAERLGCINAAAAKLGTTWPSLRKAFTRHGIGMPAPNPEAVHRIAPAGRLDTLGLGRAERPEVSVEPGTAVVTVVLAELRPPRVPPGRPVSAGSTATGQSRTETSGRRRQTGCARLPLRLWTPAAMGGVRGDR